MKKQAMGYRETGACSTAPLSLYLIINVNQPNLTWGVYY